LLPPLFGILSGAICAFGSSHNPDPASQLTLSVLLTVALGSLCASCMNAASNAINQIYDLDIDRLNKPKRPLVTGELSIKEAWVFSWVFYALALLPTWLVVVYPYSSWGAKWAAPLAFHETFFIYVLGMLATFIYSAPALGRTKAHGAWASWTMAIPRGFLLKAGGWAMVAHIWHVEPWYIGLIFTLFIYGASSTKDFADIEGDLAGGCKTLPIVYGPKKAAWIIAPFFILPWPLLPLGAYLPDPRNPAEPILTGDRTLLTLLGVVLTLWGLYTVYLLVRDPDSLTATENHPSWRHMYLMMMFAQIGFAAAYLL
jgi:4-hydroxybenzoate polyprenyltransferase